MDAMHSEREQLAERRLAEADEIRDGGDVEAADRAYAAILREHGEDVQPGARAAALRATTKRAYMIERAGRPEVAIELYDEALRRFDDDRQPEQVRQQIPLVLFNQALLLRDAGAHERSAVLLRSLRQRFPDYRRDVLAALNLATALLNLAEVDEALDVYADMAARHGGVDSDAEEREQVAHALTYRAQLLARRGRLAEALEACEQVLSRYDKGAPQLLRHVAAAAVGKGRILELQGQTEQALKVYDGVLRRFADEEDAKVHELVLWVRGRLDAYGADD